MEVRLEESSWVVNDEYIIADGTCGVHNYEIYLYGSDIDNVDPEYSSDSFEECLTWIWNSI